MRKSEKRLLGEKKAAEQAEESRRTGLIALERDRQRRAAEQEKADRRATKEARAKEQELAALKKDPKKVADAMKAVGLAASDASRAFKEFDKVVSDDAAFAPPPLAEGAVWRGPDLQVEPIIDEWSDSDEKLAAFIDAGDPLPGWHID